jgi:hypothetical protein
MFCRPCFNRFWGLKYIPHLFSEYMLTFRAEEPVKLSTLIITSGIHVYSQLFYFGMQNSSMLYHLFTDVLVVIDQVFVTELTVVIFFCSCSRFEYENSI